MRQKVACQRFRTKQATANWFKETWQQGAKLRSRKIYKRVSNGASCWLKLTWQAWACLRYIVENTCHIKPVEYKIGLKLTIELVDSFVGRWLIRTIHKCVSSALNQHIRAWQTLFRKELTYARFVCVLRQITNIELAHGDRRNFTGRRIHRH